MDEGDEPSPLEFYNSEDLVTFDAETKTGSAFYYQKPSAM